mgnify:CR=1 FL=1
MQYTTEQLADRYLAVKEINSVACEHCLYFGRRQQDLELERLWCKKAPEPRFSQNNGSFTGYAALAEHYAHSEEERKARYDRLLEKLEPEFVGQSDEVRYGTMTLSLQTLSTPLVELAGDGRTAKGLWTVTAQVTALDDKGPVGLWAYGKLAADFVLEDGAWKIWHMQALTDFVTPAGEAFDPALGAAIYPAGLGIDKTPTEPGDLYAWYSQDRPARLTPRMPEPYETFADTFSY